jgi:hypothetical protein
MTDELVKKLRERGGQWPVAAADRIEALTAKVAELEACLERQGSGHREDLDEIANVSVERLRRAEKAEAENDNAWAALWAILACETPNANATVTRMASIAKAALKGETP